MKRDAQRLRDREDPTRHTSREAGDLSRETRRDVVEGLLGQQHQRGQSFGMLHRGDLRPAPVVRDERDLVQIEAFDELGEQLGETVQREIGVGIHRTPVAPERQHRDHAPMSREQPRHNVTPERRVHQQPADEHDDRAVAAAVFVFDGPTRAAARIPPVGLPSEHRLPRRPSP